MSEYGNPYGADPYGRDPSSPSGYGQDPYERQHSADQWYAQQGYDPHYGYETPYGPPGVPYVQADTSSSVAALVCNIVAVVLCCNVLCVGGIVTAAMALSKARTDPQQTRSLTIWSWVILGGSILLEVILIALLISVSDGDSGYSSGYDSGGL